MYISYDIKYNYLYIYTIIKNKYLTIVDSLIDQKEFYIFRDDGTEVKCRITLDKKIKPFKYKLTPLEMKAITNRYFNRRITKKSHNE